jgi:hypothetical protein
MNEVDLFQANAALIVGILIFLTISPLTRKFETKKRRTIIISTCLPIGLLIASTGVILYFEGTQLAVAMGFFFAGLVAVLGTIIVVLLQEEFYEFSGRIIKRSRPE